MKKKLMSIVLFAICCLPSLAQYGTIDPSFNTGTGFKKSDGAVGRVLATATQVDGKIIVGGDFGKFNDVISKSIVRLNPDGSRDTTFNANNLGSFGILGTVKAISIQTDGKIILGGAIALIINNTTSRPNLIRLNTDGSLDASFNIPTDLFRDVRELIIQNDGKIVVGGQSSALPIETNVRRFNTDGSLDNSFSLGKLGGSSVFIYDIKLQSDNNIIIAGSFDSYSGTPIADIVRLNTNGTLDTTFNIASIGLINSTAIQTDGKIIIGGGFLSHGNNDFIKRLARLNTDGSLDSSFNIGSGPDNNISSVAIGLNGKIIIGGDFEFFNSININQIAQLNADGTLDSTFNPGTGPNSSPDFINVQPNDKIIIGGSISNFNGTTVNEIARLNAGLLDTESFFRDGMKVYPNPTTSMVTVQLSSYENTNVEVIDFTGKIVLKQMLGLNSNMVNLENIPLGIYLLKVNSSQGIATRKLVKN